MRTDLMGIQQNPHRRAQAEFQKALRELTDVSAKHFGGWVRILERDMTSTLRVLSQTAVEGIRDIKQEISVSAAISRHPGPWVAGAAITGALAGAYLAVDRNNRKLTEGQKLREQWLLERDVFRRSQSAHAEQPPDFAKREQPSRWLMLAAELVIAVMNSRRHLDGDVAKGPRD